MAYLVLAFGAVLSICGAFWMYSGYGIMLDERGWTRVIAGATMLSGGMIVMALGLLIKTLREITVLRDFSRNSIAAAPAATPSWPEDEAVLPETAPAALPEAAPARPSVFARRPRVPALLARKTGSPGASGPGEGGGSPAPAESGDTPSLVTPELQSNMLAAILSPETGEDARDPHRVRAPHIDALLDTQRQDGSPPDRSSPDGGSETIRELQVPRFELPPVPELAPVRPRQIVTLKPQTPALPRAAELVPVSPPVASGTVPEDAPAMDDWLDRAFSALDHETGINPLPEPPARSGEPEPEHLTPIHDPGEVPHSGRSGDELAAVEPAASIPAGPEIREPHEALAPEITPAAGSAEIGRYDADGTSYIMYADGSIDAHSDAGTYRFGSMAELKTYLEGAG